MGGFRLGGVRRVLDEQATARERLKGLVRDMLGLAPDDAVTVSEIGCRDPGCSDIETVILVMRAGQKTQAYKIADAIDLVGADDLREALGERVSDAP